MLNFIQKAEFQENPLRMVYDFLETEKKAEESEHYNEMRFVGYAMEMSYDTARIITSDPYKRAVGGLPKGSFLVMLPDKLDGIPPHFTLLRVEDVAPTPLSQQVQQTYFELHKKSMPEIDRWTQSELQWGALNTTVLGMFYPDIENSEELAFSGDVNTVVSAHRYRIYSPDQKLLDLIVNGTVRKERQISIGDLRMTECRLPFANVSPHNVSAQISVRDFQGFRTAMFGKTRLGKSNVVKLLAEAVIKATDEKRDVGQLIFDINGEYANDNPQDGNISIRSKYSERCQVYALNPREGADYAKQLKLNFYEQPDSGLSILKSFLTQANKTSDYIKSFMSVELPNVEDIPHMEQSPKRRSIRKIQIYWAILHSAGFKADESRLSRLGGKVGEAPFGYDPHFKKTLREKAYSNADQEVPNTPKNLSELLNELRVIDSFRKENPGDKELKSSGGKDYFDIDDVAMLEFLFPKQGRSGTVILRPFIIYHSMSAGDFQKEILDLIDAGQTVILDLGNATDEVRRYFSDMLSRAVFNNQEKKFISNNLSEHFVQLYFEEAHNLFPRDNKEFTDVYSRFAKEGAKFHIGMVYSTQSPSTISQELLAQTENFFVGHLSSQDEVRSLERVQIAYEGLGSEIMRSKTPGYMRMLTFSHRFVVPIQAYKFE
ncbi:hypothetical protein B4O97_01710 [Marispirochaeta aestuarii]|uniref:Helicase HerA central domain-containing protein n=1 Tax=Marispirochaeta aestuarii TaxID=1963862 RepID=A0A1Y1S1X8_9SPIO|nr:DUF87 domain-containing protein [Marispirochaeta aestuarii]ORC37743.1 hypothetical protein B4O97_01710 [Marispirochaeta aestuarii]